MPDLHFRHKASRRQKADSFNPLCSRFRSCWREPEASRWMTTERLSHKVALTRPAILLSEARPVAASPPPLRHADMANAIRALAMDAVEKAKSGHPGLPMGAADIATVLFTKS
jgi:hypothetical protein